MKKSIWGALIVGVIFGLGLSYIIAVEVKKTGTPEFCESCHTMKPMADSFRLSVHGGNNPHGFAVESCTDCHLPHNSLIGYLVAKGISGTKDTLAEIGLIKSVDFKKNFWNMHEYVYDSACLKCHAGIKNPEKSMGLSPQIKLIHQKYYWDAKAAGKKVSCVSCHNDYTDTNFAHPNLLEMLPNSQK